MAPAGAINFLQCKNALHTGHFGEFNGNTALQAPVRCNIFVAESLVMESFAQGFTDGPGPSPAPLLADQGALSAPGVEELRLSTDIPAPGTGLALVFR